MTNCEVALKNMVSISEFNKGQADKIFDEVKLSGTKIVMNDDKPECVLVSVDEYEKMINEINDMKILLMAIERMDNFDGNMKDTFSQEDIERILDVDSNDYNSVKIN